MNSQVGNLPSLVFSDRPGPTALLDDLNTSGVVTALNVLNREAGAGRHNVEAACKLNCALRFLGIWNGEKTNRRARDIYSVILTTLRTATLHAPS